MTGYRFIFEDINHEDNFKPVLERDPKRVLKFTTEQEKCSGYALSFFDTLEHARSRYRALVRNFRKIEQKLGTHVAKVQIDETDGVCSETGRDGHFAVHEYPTTNFMRKILEIERI